MEKNLLVNYMARKILFTFIFLISPLCLAAIETTGSYSLTSNVSAENSKTYYFAHKFQFNFKPEGSQHSFDFRDENYSEGSFHGTDPAEVIVENKAETQFSYNYALNENLSWFIGGLHHSNYTIRDTYGWYLTGLNVSLSPFELTSINGSLTATKRAQGGRIFYDASFGVENTFHPMFTLFTSLHRYENFGETDISPSKKMEFELGVSHRPSGRFSFGLSYFKHTQDDDSLDTFAAYRFRSTYLF